MMNNDLSIGFIGAGRVGMTFGRYFYEKKLNVSGFFSRTAGNAFEAAEFTESKAYDSLCELTAESDIIFITVPDSAIQSVYNQLLKYDIKDKILCHCSGAMSAKVFENIEMYGAYGCSVHPAFAISDKRNSYKQIGNAFFTVEGDAHSLHIITELLDRLGNPYQVIDAESKCKYHTALATASNLVIALYRISERLLTECGFSASSAESVINPLFLNNAENVCRNGALAALTGPIDRNDISTVEKHLSVLDDETSDLYKLLSAELVRTAKQKYPERNYSELENLLRS